MPGGLNETLIYAVYYAPRGRARLYKLGHEIAQRHLFPDDLLFGIIGEQGSGKSTLINGLFPGVELTNDDEGINRPTSRLFEFDGNSHFSPHTFHIDVRFEQAFHQMYEIVNAVNAALKRKKRVIIEHFDLLYPHLNYNAQVLFGVGEEVIVTRPSVFGPLPDSIKNVVYKTVIYRKMAHSAEDITTSILFRKYNCEISDIHSDVKHGFIICFDKKPEFDIKLLEADVRAVISEDVSIAADGEDYIRIGDQKIKCTGTRIHVPSSGKIKNFRLFNDIQYDPITRRYMLIGLVGEEDGELGFDKILNVIG